MLAYRYIVVTGLVFLIGVFLIMNVETYTNDSNKIMTIKDGSIITTNTDDVNTEIMLKFDKISKAIAPGNGINFKLTEWYPVKPHSSHRGSGFGSCVHGGLGARCTKRGECRTSVNCPQGTIPWDLDGQCTCAYGIPGRPGGFSFKAV
jgi:hypothetical protein